MASMWNRFLERMLAEDGMTAAEYRLLTALARLLLGWRRTEARLGRQHIRDISRLDGRTLDRSRAKLVERGLLRYEPGRRGRGARGLYALDWLLEKDAPERHLPQSRKGRSPGTENDAPERPRIERGKGKTRKTDCIWHGYDKASLRVDQLHECGCAICEDWATHAVEAVAP